MATRKEIKLIIAAKEHTDEVLMECLYNMEVSEIRSFILDLIEVENSNEN